jgi:hypothetical protein
VTGDLEYYGRIVTHDNRKLFFPATAPVINQTVVVFEKSDSPGAGDGRQKGGQTGGDAYPIPVPGPFPPVMIWPCTFHWP